MPPLCALSNIEEKMRRIITFLLILSVGYFALNEAGFVDRLAIEPSSSDSMVIDSFENRKSDVQVRGQGEVIKVLSDDNDGSRHQRFILRISPDITVLVAHNIDLAPRISGLVEGDKVEFYGEYEWNERGGVIHWTHHDPQGRHAGGWLKHRGEMYQ